MIENTCWHLICYLKGMTERSVTATVAARNRAARARREGWLVEWIEAWPASQAFAAGSRRCERAYMSEAAARTFAAQLARPAAVAGDFENSDISVRQS